MKREQREKRRAAIRERREGRRASRGRKRGRPDASFSARSQVLLGAAIAFGKRGYADTSVEHILKAADVSRRTFYKSFKNKEGVLIELYDTATLIFLQSLHNAAALATEREKKLENCIEVYLRAPQTAGPIFHVLQAEANNPGSKLASRRLTVIKQIMALFDEQVQAAQKRTLDPLLYRGIVSALEAISIALYEDGEPDDSDIERARSVMMQLVGGALAQPEDSPALQSR